MPKIHVYVRSQVTADDVSSISQAVDGLRRAITAAGGDWNGGATVEPEGPPTGLPVTEPAVEDVPDEKPEEAPEETAMLGEPEEVAVKHRGRHRGHR